MSASNNHYSHHRLIFTPESRISLRICPLYDLLHDKYVNALDHSYPLDQHYDRFWLSIYGSCNGLLCVLMDKDSLLIWNPVTRSSSRLPHGFKRYDWNVFYGFGYDETMDDYKVVGISRLFRYPYIGCNKSKVKIYSLKTGIWKKIGNFPHLFPFNDSGKFSNGALHWVAERSSYSWTIVSIDLADETYGEILQPPYDEGKMDLRLGVLGECLCVLCNYSGDRADVWVMKVYGLKDSWTKLLSIPYLTGPGREKFSMPLVISNDGKVLLQSGMKLIVYDSQNRTFSKIQNFDGCIEANTFVESLISPPVRWKFRKRRNGDFLSRTGF